MIPKLYFLSLFMSVRWKKLWYLSFSSDVYSLCYVIWLFVCFCFVVHIRSKYVASSFQSFQKEETHTKANRFSFPNFLYCSDPGCSAIQFTHSSKQQHGCYQKGIDPQDIIKRVRMSVQHTVTDYLEVFGTFWPIGKCRT